MIKISDEIFRCFDRLTSVTDGHTDGQTNGRMDSQKYDGIYHAL